MNSQKINIEAEISGSPEAIWNFYTKPEHIVNWNFAHESWHCPHAENDLKPGGKYLATMAARDGSFSFDFEAVYDVVKPFETIVYTMTDGRKAEINFLEKNNLTSVTICFDAESTNPVEIQQQGWRAILNNFKSYAEQNSEIK